MKSAKKLFFAAFLVCAMWPKGCLPSIQGHVEGRLGLWENAIVSLIKLYANQDMPELKSVCTIHVKPDVMEMLNAKV